MNCKEKSYDQKELVQVLAHRNIVLMRMLCKYNTRDQGSPQVEIETKVALYYENWF